VGDLLGQLPPTRVYGTVQINGETPPIGTLVEAFVHGNRCGSGEVRDVGAPVGVGYVVDVDADAFTPGCGNNGDTITFRVGGVDAAETATFQTGAFVEQNLTGSGQPAPQPTATPTPTPAAQPSPSPAASPAPAPTPQPGQTPSPEPSPAPGPAETPTATVTPEGTPAPSPAGTMTPTATPSRTATPAGGVTTIRPADTDGDGDGIAPAVWVAGVLAILAVAGAGAYFVQRARRRPPA
jgi:hypothetical protein